MIIVRTTTAKRLSVITWYIVIFGKLIISLPLKILVGLHRWKNMLRCVRCVITQKRKEIIRKRETEEKEWLMIVLVVTEVVVGTAAAGSTAE